MRYQLVLIYLLSFLFLFTCCSEANTVIGIMQEVTQYSVKTFIVEKTPELSIAIDIGSVEIYTWKKNEIKFEITKKIRGVQNKEILTKKLDDFQVAYKIADNHISYKSTYKGSIKNPNDKSIELKIFIPKKILNINCNMNAGRIKIFDQIKCNLMIQMKTVNTEINMVKGKVYLNGDKGDFCINNGELYPDSFIKVNSGNINIKAALLSNGNYNFETGKGNLELALPKQSKISFENIGTFNSNDFISEESMTKVRLVTDMGKIIVKKY